MGGYGSAKDAESWPETTEWDGWGRREGAYGATSQPGRFCPCGQGPAGGPQALSREAQAMPSRA